MTWRSNNNLSDICRTLHPYWHQTSLLRENNLTDTQLFLAVRNQISLTTEFKPHKRPSVANSPQPRQMGLGGGGGIDSNQGTGYWHPRAIFLAESHPQQANKSKPSRESSRQDRERMAVIRLFQFKAPGGIFGSQWVRERHCSSQSSGGALRPFNITN